MGSEGQMVNKVEDTFINECVSGIVGDEKL
jgi:hypothetical protein